MHNIGGVSDTRWHDSLSMKYSAGCVIITECGGLFDIIVYTDKYNSGFCWIKHMIHMYLCLELFYIISDITKYHSEKW